jgi:hypothetical protein
MKCQFGINLFTSEKSLTAALLRLLDVEPTDSVCGKTVDVVVQLLDGIQFNVQLEDGSTVAELKDAIHTALGTAVDHQYLFTVGDDDAADTDTDSDTANDTDTDTENDTDTETDDLGANDENIFQEPLSDDRQIWASCTVVLSIEPEPEPEWLLNTSPERDVFDEMTYFGALL